MNKKPNLNCLTCKGRGYYLRSNGKIPVLKMYDYENGWSQFKPDYCNIPESENLIQCSCWGHWK